MTRRRSLTTIVVYWFALLAGLALFTATRRGDDVDVAGMWIGVVGGTALGQFLAARDLRLWVVILIVGAFFILCGPFTPLHDGGLLFWMALIPATLCGWMSLSDRGSLIAFWFPSVVWMLTILDRGQGALKFESGSAALLGGLAFMFIAFLYARETRRIDLWRTVAPTPIAPETKPVILKEVPRLHIGLAGWSIAVSGVAFAVCAWLAPRMWHVEELVPELHVSTVDMRLDPSDVAADGGQRPKHLCCHDLYMMREQKRARVKEYFDVGRGHEEDDGDAEQMLSGECVVCGPDGNPIDANRYAYGNCDRPYLGTGSYYDGTTGSYDCVPGLGGGGYAGGGTGGYAGGGTGGGYAGGGTGGNAGGGTGGNAGGGTGGYAGNGAAGGYGGYTPPSYTPPSYTPPSYTPPAEPSYTPPSYTPPVEPTYTPPAPEPPSHTPEPPPAYDEPRPNTGGELEPNPDVPPPSTDNPRGDLPSPRLDDPPAPTPPAIAAAPTAPSTPATTIPSATSAQRATTRTDDGPPILYWVFVVLAGGLAFQMLALGLRPVRRLLTLRHLRRPFWNETVDQRVSNYWHLVLVGLRDAGWRTTTGEAPRELAKRLDIDGVEKAATILERARHGVGIDATDLAEMGEVSEQAYRASRERTSAFARLLAWFRRPLV